MNQEKIKKIAVFALVLALLTLSQSGAISSVINYNSITDNNHSNLSHLDYTSSNHTGFESSSHASSTYLSQTSALLLYEQKIPFQIHSHKPPFGIPYEDGGQIDYYNLKNISLLPYDILLSNYTNNYNWVNNSTMASDDTKVNKSGDKMNEKSNFDFSNSSLNSVSYINTSGTLKLYNSGGSGVLIEGVRSDFTRNVAGTPTGILTTSIQKINVTSGNCAGSCGVSNVISTQDQTNGTIIIGKWGISWAPTRADNYSIIQFWATKSVADAGSTEVFRGYGNNQTLEVQKNISIIGTGIQIKDISGGLHCMTVSSTNIISSVSGQCG